MAAVVSGVVMTSGAATLWGATAARAGGRSPGGAAGRLQILYTAPVLVRAGERVLLPVDAVCVTARGIACPARVSMRAAAGLGSYRAASAAASTGLRFDLSAPAADATAGGTHSGFVRFSIEAAGGGASASLPSESDDSPLTFYVSASIPTARVPSVPFGRMRRGRAVLSLPWGTGADRAGIALGGGEAPSGPSSFDVDGSGRVFLLDNEQSRLGVFARGTLVRSTSLSLPPGSDVSVSPRGAAFVLSRDRGDRLRVTPVGPGGATGSVLPAGSGIPGAIRAIGGGAYVHVFPLDAWRLVSPPGAGPEAARLQVGEPLAGDRQLLSVVRGRSVRLATVLDGRVRDPVEVDFRAALGELALAAPDGAGGYWLIVHVWRGGRHPADAFQAVRVDGSRVVATFLLPGRSFTAGSPQSMFRVAPDGALYQLMTTRAGARVVRYRIGGES